MVCGWGAQGCCRGAPGCCRGAAGVPMRRPRGGGADPYSPGFHRCAKTIENISRIRMVVARASGTLMASSLKQNKFLTLKLHPQARSVLSCGGDALREGDPPYFHTQFVLSSPPPIKSRGVGVLGGQRGAGYRWASAIDLIYRIKMVVARASGTLIASSLEQNKFWTLKLHRAGGVRAGRGATGALIKVTYLGGVVPPPR